MPIRKLGDIPAARNAFFDEAKKGVQDLFPVENEAARLDAGNIRYGGSEPSRKEERRAVVRGGTLSRPLKADLTLTDKDTEEVLGTKTRTLAHIPYLTDRGVFVYRGSDYSGSSQFQLRPGVYTRVTQSGNIESPIHARGGRGMSIAFDPQSNEFRLKVQQSNLKLYPLLRALGVEDETLRSLWGEELLEINKGRTDPRALSRVARKLTGESYDPENIGEKLRTILAQSRVDPAITEKATGIHTNHITPRLLTAITGKLLGISRGEERPTARDALYAQKVATPEILLRQSLGRSGPELSRRLWKAYNSKSIDKIPSGVLNPAVKSLLFTSGLFQPIEEMNPLEARDKMYRITRTGRGGLSGHATPEEARLLHPSHAGLLDFVRTVESESVGTDLRSSLNTAVDEEGNFYTRLINAKTGEDEIVPTYQMKDLTVGLPGQEDVGSPLAVVGGDEQRKVNREDVDYFIPTLQEMVSPMTNLIPGLTGVYQGRSLVGAKYPLQSLPMEKKEAPLVQVEHPGGGTFEDKLAEQAGAIRSPVSGTVKEVDDTHITVREKDGETRTFGLYHNLPHNRKSALLQTSHVTVGQPVEEGDLLASSNYTTSGGTLALGKNLRTGFLPGSETFEDAIGISESAAKKLTVEKTRPIELEDTDELQPGKNRFIVEFPGKYDRKQLDTITDEGVVKEGTKVEKGDPLILAVNVPEDQPYYHQLRRSGVRHQDAAVEWEDDYPGTVTDAVKTKDGFRVFVKTKAPAVTGDKLAQRQGSKGIAVVIPDEEMPQDEEGNPLDMLISSLAITSRRNPALVAEAWLGKAARERGRPYKLPAHPAEGGFAQTALDELEKHGLTPNETLYDPKTGQKIPDVLTGDIYTYRLSHTAKGKGRGRSLGGHTAAGIPTRGGKSSGKKISRQPLNALLSHGALGVIEDAMKLRGASNKDFWEAMRLGYNPPVPEIPYVHQKLFESLKGAGIDIRQTGEKFHLAPLTDREVEEISSGPVTSSAMLDRKTMRPKGDGGLFDPGVTGGPGGKKWSHHPLPFALPNPLMEKPISRLLRIRQKDVKDIVTGKETLNDKTGPEAIRDALTRIDVKRRIGYLEGHLKGMNKTQKDKAIKELKHLRALDKYDISPESLMVSKIPILPPTARPISQIAGLEQPVVSDANRLYKDLIDLSNAYRQAEDILPEDRLRSYRGRLYDAVKAVYGLGDPVTRESRDKNVRGILKTVFGDSPKHSQFQMEVLGRPQNLSGLAVVSPRSDLNIDQIGLPKKLAWEVYRPFLMRYLVNTGMKPTQAVTEVKEQTDKAEKALQEVVEKRPVIVNRAPTLHQFSMMAFWPVLHDGDTLQVSPATTQGFGMDFDGNCCSGKDLQKLRFDLSELQNSPEFYSAIMDIYESKFGESPKSEVIELVMRMDEFPSVGDFITDKNGAKVYSVPSGVSTSTFDLEEGNVCYGSISHFTVEEDRECVEVETARGQKVTVSTNESLCVFDPDICELEKICPEEVQDKLVPVIKTHSDFGNYGSFDLGWWYGSLISEGWTSIGRTVGFSNSDKERLHAFSEIAKVEFSSDFELHQYSAREEDSLEKYADSAKVHLNSTALVKEILPISESGESRQCTRKRIPPTLLGNGSEECLQGLLTGLLEGDGSLSWNTSSKRTKRQFQVSYSTTSERLAHDIFTLCQKLGIRTTISPYEREAEFRKAYILSLSTIDFSRHVDNFRFVGAREKRLSRELQGLELGTDKRDLVPFPKDLARAMRNCIRDCVGTDSPLYNLCTDIMGKRRQIEYTTRATAKRLLAFMPDEFEHSKLDNIRELVELEGVTWTKIKAVEKVDSQTVYDFHVEPSKIFALANGLVIYDTALFHVPVLPNAVEDALKMLPSRNLRNPKRGETVYRPWKEFAEGIYLASRRGKGRAKTFATPEEAIRKYKQGKVPVDQKILIPT